MSKPTAMPPLVTADGVSLSYYKIGQGPGLIVLHGAVCTAHSSFDLAIALSDTYTVYLPSRRCRGTSGAFPPHVTDATNVLTQSPVDKGEEGDSKFKPSYNREFSSSVLQTELSDLAALVHETKAPYLLGISSGALISLAACLISSIASKTEMPIELVDLSGIKKVILFEPPLFFSDTISKDPDGPGLAQIRRYEEETAKGDIASSLVTAMKLVQLGPGWVRASPRFVIRFMTQMILNYEAKQGYRNGEDDKLGIIIIAGLAPTIRYDFAIVEAMIGPSERFADATGGRDLLLLGGDQSPGYLTRALGVLEGVMKVQRVEMKGSGHEVMGNSNVRGNPSKAKEEIKKFLE